MHTSRPSGSGRRLPRAADAVPPLRVSMPNAPAGCQKSTGEFRHYWRHAMRLIYIAVADGDRVLLPLRQSPAAAACCSRYYAQPHARGRAAEMFIMREASSICAAPLASISRLMSRSLAGEARYYSH